MATVAGLGAGESEVDIEGSPALQQTCPGQLQRDAFVQHQFCPTKQAGPAEGTSPIPALGGCTSFISPPEQMWRPPGRHP